MATQKNLIHEVSSTTGTGNFTTVAVNGKVQCGDATNGFGTGGTPNVFDYFISNRDAAEWERGTGHCSALGALVRDTVLASSNANALVNFSAGTKDVTNDIPAAKQLRSDNNLSDLGAAATARTNLGSTTIGDALFIAANAAGARTTLGASTIGGNLFTAASASTALALLLASGTVCVFGQTSAPTGFTKVTSGNDRLLRLVNGTASTGGSIAFSTFAAATVVGSTAISAAQMPPHTHTYDWLVLNPNGQPGGGIGGWSSTATGTTGGAGSGAGHDHSINHNITYSDVIFATKD
jgi:hypothetical protein